MTTKEQTTETTTTVKNREELEKIISKALNKIGGSKISDICRYLPHGGGYMHHFTLEKYKIKEPNFLISEINKYIIDADRPRRVPHKPRAARGSRSQQLKFTQREIERLLRYCLEKNDVELIAKLTDNRSLKVLSQQLTKAILRGDATPEMWNAYYEVKKAKETTSFGMPMDAHFTESSTYEQEAVTAAEALEAALSAATKN